MPGGTDLYYIPFIPFIFFNNVGHKQILPPNHENSWVKKVSLGYFLVRVEEDCIHDVW